MVPPSPTPDADAFHALYRQYAPRVLAFLRTRLPAAAVSDVHQETWTHVWQKFPQRDGETTNFRGWLFTIADHCRIDYLRRRRAQSLGDEVDVVDTGAATPLALLIDGERRDAVSRCLGRLDDAARSIVVRSCEGTPAETLARELGLSVDTVYQRKSRALKALRACLERELA